MKKRAIPAADHLVAYLNGSKPEDAAGRANLIAMMELFHRALQLIEQHPDWNGSYDATRPEELELVEEHLYARLQEYRYELLFDVDRRKQWEFTWLLVAKSPRVDEWATGAEVAAVESMLSLGRERSLPRVRKCPGCGRWFFAKFSHQHTCSPACRDMVYTSSEEFKTHRRKYMRKYMRQYYRQQKAASRRHK